MKKYLLLSGVAMVVMLAGCAQTEQPVKSETSNTTNDQSSTQTSLSGTDTTMCPQAIKDHLAKADIKGKWTQTVKKDDQITVHYVGRLNDKDVFDTSVEAVAKACGKYSPSRNYNEGLSFKVGAGQMIPGFDKGVEGMKLGQTKTITIKAKDAYGEWSKDNLIVVDRTQLPQGNLEIGVKLQSADGRTFTVYAIDGDKVTLDANPELAGKDLIFDISIESIK